MADLLQKVYLLFVRPIYSSSGGAQTVHKGSIYARQAQTTTCSSRQEFQVAHKILPLI